MVGGGVAKANAFNYDSRKRKMGTENGKMGNGMKMVRSGWLRRMAG